MAMPNEFFEIAQRFRELANYFERLATAGLPPSPQIESRPWDNLWLSVRTYNGVLEYFKRRAKESGRNPMSYTIGDLREVHDAELLNIKGFGRKCLRELNDALAYPEIKNTSR